MEPPPPPQYHPGRGWLAKLGQHLLGAAEGVGAGLATGHPLGGAIMGVAGGVHPQLGANAWYNNVTLPKWEAQQEQALDRAGKRLGILGQIAPLAGVDATSGDLTPSVRLGQERLEALQAKNESDRLAGQEKLRQAEEKLQQGQQRIEQLGSHITNVETSNRIHNIIAAARLPGRTVDPASRDFIQKAIGITLPDQFDPTRDFLVQDNTGQWRLIQIGHGSGNVSTTPTGVMGAPKDRHRARTRTLTRQQYHLQVKKASKDPRETTADGKAKVDAWMRQNGFKVGDQ
jgi:hypothetical protein